MRCNDPVLDLYTKTCYFHLYTVWSGEIRKHIYILCDVSNYCCYCRMLCDSKKWSRKIRKYNGTDERMENSSDGNRLYSGNVYYKTWHDACIRFLSLQSPVLYNQWDSMVRNCFSDYYSEKGKTFHNEKKINFIIDKILSLLYTSIQAKALGNISAPFLFWTKDISSHLNVKLCYHKEVEGGNIDFTFFIEEE